MRIYIADINKCDFNFDERFSMLSKEEQNKVYNYKNKEDKVRSLLGYSLIKKFTSDEPVFFSELGKPLKMNSYFNVSHSGDIVVLAVSDFHNIGVDVENKNRDKKQLDLKLFQKEMEQVSFIENWTRLEALLKCAGVGFHKGYKNVPHNEGLNKYEGNDYFIRTFKSDDYVISVATENELETVEIILVPYL